MTGCNLIATLLLTSILSLGCLASEAEAFHSGGVGSCSGCHVSHDNGAFSSKLLASDPSSVCLTCHAGSGGNGSPSVFSFDGSALTPGGDFYWLTKTYTWTGGSSPAARHGHNVVARDFGLDSDPNKVNSPGGSFPSTQFSCISCHDPHGRSRGGTSGGAAAVSLSGSYGEMPPTGSTSGSYRLLGDADYRINGFSFNSPAPVARQNKLLPFAESDSSHVDYGSGMSEWCGNCHQALLTNGHQVGSGSFTHPVGSDQLLGTEIVSRYNSYVKSGDLSGAIDSAYLQFVPFERGTADPDLLDPISTRGPDASARISCLSCHRAHASAFRSAGRWDFSATLLADSHPAVGDSSATASDVSNSYYGRNIAVEFGASQGPFCEKCHAEGAP